MYVCMHEFIFFTHKFPCIRIERFILMLFSLLSEVAEYILVMQLFYDEYSEKLRQWKFCEESAFKFSCMYILVCVCVT